jgi:hypothetical protein
MNVMFEENESQGLEPAAGAARPSNPGEERPRVPQERRGTRRIRLTRSIILGGQHAEEGSVHDVAPALAHRLIGEGSAVEHLEEGEAPEKSPTTVTTHMEEATSREPQPRQVAPAPPKVRGRAAR